MTDEVILAQRDALRMALKAVLKLIDHNSFLWPHEQAIVNRAEALLAETQ